MKLRRKFIAVSAAAGVGRIAAGLLGYASIAAVGAAAMVLLVIIAPWTEP